MDKKAALITGYLQSISGKHHVVVVVVVVVGIVVVIVVFVIFSTMAVVYVTTAATTIGHYHYQWQCLIASIFGQFTLNL